MLSDLYHSSVHNGPMQPANTGLQPQVPMQSVSNLLVQPRPPHPPTVQAVTAFLASFLPIRQNDTPFTYHVPRAYSFNPATAPVDHIVFSITPTDGVYEALNRPGRVPSMAFLHRPFDLDRRRIRRGSTVLSCHKGFDEVLTVGWNIVLASRLGMNVDQSACVQGYKGDPDRRIGILGSAQTTAGGLLEAVKMEFGTVESVFGVSDEDVSSMAQPISAVAIMNAFHPEEVDRVLTAAYENGWIDSTNDGSKLLYLTGQAREPGLVAAMEKGINVICVGHRICEEWGIRYLASRIRQEFPLLKVDEVYEDEVPRPPRPVQAVKHGKAGGLETST